MPTYDYKCSSCGHMLEAFQGINDDPLRKCPKCSKHKLERLISAGAGIIFKGSGFYATDYSSSSRAPSPGSDGESSDSTDSGGGSDD